jgi:hypothetical protein
MPRLGELGTLSSSRRLQSSSTSGALSSRGVGGDGGDVLDAADLEAGTGQGAEGGLGTGSGGLGAVAAGGSDLDVHGGDAC